MKYTHVALAGVLLLSACGLPEINAQPPVQHTAEVQLKQADSREITCTGGTDCAQKWQRALAWVTKNSTYSIKTQTDTVIETNGPLEPTTDSAFRITKSQAGAGGEEIFFASTCGSIGRPCDPPAGVLKKNFINYVMYGY